MAWGRGDANALEPVTSYGPPLWTIARTGFDDTQGEAALSQAGFEPFAVSGNVTIWRKKG